MPPLPIDSAKNIDCYVLILKASRLLKESTRKVNQTSSSTELEFPGDSLDWVTSFNEFVEEFICLPP